MCGPCARIIHPEIYCKDLERLKRRNLKLEMQKRVGRLERRQYVICDCGRYLVRLHYQDLGMKSLKAFYCRDCKYIGMCTKELRARHIKVKGIN